MGRNIIIIIRALLQAHAIVNLMFLLRYYNKEMKDFDDRGV